MSYKRAEEILPIEIIEMIQFYIDGENIYIPRKEEHKIKWGNKTQIREELQERNALIFAEYKDGLTVAVLANKYFLSEKSIQRIIREMKKTA